MHPQAILFHKVDLRLLFQPLHRETARQCLSGQTSYMSSCVWFSKPSIRLGTNHWVVVGTVNQTRSKHRASIGLPNSSTPFATTPKPVLRRNCGFPSAIVVMPNDIRLVRAQQRAQSMYEYSMVLSITAFFRKDNAANGPRPDVMPCCQRCRRLQ